MNALKEAEARCISAEARHIEGRPITLAEIGPIHLRPDAVSRLYVAAQGDEIPVPSPITPDAKDLGLNPPYCTCGHDWDRHRRGRCWTSWNGEPVHRARTQIDCRCDQGAKS